MQTKTTNKSRDVALIAIMAALYAVGVVFFAPIGFSPVIQVRIADILLPLSILFGPPAIVGLGIGVLIGNFFASPFGGIDVVGGTIANLVATSLAWIIGRRAFRGAWVSAIAVEILVITLVVGSYLTLFVTFPIWLNWFGVLVGEIIAVGVGGYALLKAVDRVMRRSFR